MSELKIGQIWQHLKPNGEKVEIEIVDIFFKTVNNQIRPITHFRDLSEPERIRVDSDGFTAQQFLISDEFSDKWEIKDNSKV